MLASPFAVWLAVVSVIVAQKGDDRPLFVPSNPPGEWTQTTKLPFNARVLEFCRKNVGKTVGTGPTRGECAELNGHALLSAGARARFAPRTDTGSRGDYVWGKLVATLTAGKVDAAAVQPGDLLQIRGPRSGLSFRGPASNGGIYQGGYTQHSAVVQAVGKTDESWWLMTYDQNLLGPSGKLERRVQEGTRLKLRDLQEGTTIWVYRPVAR